MENHSFDMGLSILYIALMMLHVAIPWTLSERLGGYPCLTVL